ncbi:MAG TPA: transposase [Prolixibacteraceae bacterium]|nr:transposase [Prolixibacteraceae bacterium]
MQSLKKAQQDYYFALRKYRLAYDKVLHKATHHPVSLVKEANLAVLKEALLFWEGRRLISHAWCIMSNHLHWLLTVFEKDEAEEAVHLPEILHSVKRFSARKININEGRSGELWEHESFETTIRNDRHFVRVESYIVNNPVSAGLVTTAREWPGTFVRAGSSIF